MARNILRYIEKQFDSYKEEVEKDTTAEDTLKYNNGGMP